jgi:hypothetical protein
MRLIALAALLLSSPAFGHVLFWTKVTHYDDGSEIVEPVSYLIEWSDGDEDFTTVDGTRTLTAASATMPDPVGLLRCYRVFAVVPTEGRSAMPSNVWCKDMRRRPNAPTGLSGN